MIFISPYLCSIRPATFRATRKARRCSATCSLQRLHAGATPLHGGFSSLHWQASARLRILSYVVLQLADHLSVQVGRHTRSDLPQDYQSCVLFPPHVAFSLHLFSSLPTCGASAPPPSAPRRPSGAVQQHALASSPTPSPNTCETPFLAKSWLWIVSFRRSIISSKGIFRQSLVDNALTSFDLSVLSSNPHCQR